MQQRSWTDHIVAERMTVDQAFADQVQESRFSSQEWGLIMTATEFTIEQPADPGAARIVAETNQLEDILPELGNLRSQMGPGETQSGGGVLSAIKKTFGLESGPDPEERAAAERLTQAYAEALQAHLEDTGRWQEIRRVASRT
ncbi:MAG: DUF5799 family protein [Natrialbaceae archaeon]|nr:DUF5799 family protein [Natrialbaceae archaeon]